MWEAILRISSVGRRSTAGEGVILADWTKLAVAGTGGFMTGAGMEF